MESKNMLERFEFELGDLGREYLHAKTRRYTGTVTITVFRAGPAVRGRPNSNLQTSVVAEPAEEKP